MIETFKKRIIKATCELCGKIEKIEERYINEFKNSVYACRSKGWAVTSNRKCYCPSCRNDKYRYKRY